MSVPPYYMAALIVNAASGKSRSKSEKNHGRVLERKKAKFMAQFTAILCSKNFMPTTTFTSCLLRNVIVYAIVSVSFSLIKFLI